MTGAPAGLVLRRIYPFATLLVQQIKWNLRSRSSTIGGKENVRATDMERGGSGGSGGVKVGDRFVEFGQQEPVGFGIGVKDG